MQNLSISAHLQSVLEKNNVSEYDSFLSSYRNQRDKIKEFLEQHFRGRIYTPFNSGSYAKSTHIKSKFDMDIIIPFKKGNFTLEQMHEEVYNVLKNKFGNEYDIRKQRTSIGLYKGQFFIDVVPARELQHGIYIDNSSLDNKSLNLYSSNSSGVPYVQTNIHKQIAHIKGKDKERSVIRLLKIWKAKNNIDCKSFFIELFVIRAFSEVEMGSNIETNLKNTLMYMKSKLSMGNFRLIDPGNSGNNLIDTLDFYSKNNLINKINSLLINWSRISSYIY